jgi:hypothetical protein
MAIKHQQLARQVGVFIEHPPENSMASFSFASTMLDEGTTFIFGSWICIGNGLGGFKYHLVDSRKPKVSIPTQYCNLDEVINNLVELLLPDLARQIEKMSVFNATSTRAALELVGSDSNQSEGTTQSKSLSNLEEDLDLLLNLKDVGATACRGAPIFDNYSDSNEEYSSISNTPSSQSRGGFGDEGATACRGAPALENHSQIDDYPELFSGNHLGLTITSMPHGHFVYWKDLEPSELLDYDCRLVAFMQEFPFKEGKPLSHRGRGSQ